MEEVNIPFGLHSCDGTGNDGQKTWKGKYVRGRGKGKR